MEDLSKYKGNPRFGVDPTETPKKPRVSPVISTPPTVVRPAVWSRLRQVISAEAASGAVGMAFDEVVIPKIKETVVDFGNSLLHRIFYPDGGGSSSSNNRSFSSNRFTPYDRMDAKKRNRYANIDDERDTYDFTRYSFKNAGLAEAVADKLVDLVDEYGIATVNDFHDAMGLTGEFTDDNFGWTRENFTVRVLRRRDGYILDLPRPRQINN